MRAQRINDSNEKGADIEIIFVDCEDKTKTKPTLFTLEIKTKMKKTDLYQVVYYLHTEVQSYAKQVFYEVYATKIKSSSSNTRKWREVIHFR